MCHYDDEMQALPHPLFMLDATLGDLGTKVRDRRLISSAKGNCLMVKIEAL